jgi:hypothetical protein
MVPVSASGRGRAGSVVVTPRRLASGSKVVPCRIVEITTAKKTMLKKVLDPSTSSITGKVASTTGTAPRRPAQPSTTRSAIEKRSNAVLTKVATGRATNTSTSASAVPLTATSPRSLGKTSRPSARNMEICAIQARPWWNTVTVRLAGMREDPSISPAR